MKKIIAERVVGMIDDTILAVQNAMKADEIPILQGDDIINGLLDARIATTAKAPRERGELEPVA